jgi:menaquinone-9 beta-reductase
VAAGSADALAGYQEERDAISSDLFEVTDSIASHAWSVDELKGLHLALNEAMRRDLAVIGAFGPPDRPAAADVGAVALAAAG